MNRQKMVAFSAISLTDIVLLLLIFFLLSSSFIIQPGIKVSLPKAASGQPEKEQQVYVTVTREEQIFLNQRAVSKSELSRELRRLLSENPQRVVVIRADGRLSLEKAVSVIDVAKLAGAQRFMIATQPGL
jgi:biopolymer transport protein ExbD